MIRNSFFSVLYWDPNPKAFSIPFFDFPIFWYGIFFALGFWLGFHCFVWILSRDLKQISCCHSFKRDELRKRVHAIADRMAVYVIIGTVIGARLGHFIFYENPFDYLSNPWILLQIREGGLASHGAVAGIVISLLFFNYRIKPEIQKPMPLLRWLDLLSPSAALAACFIRIGNFLNQEILGTSSTLPWAVVFGHPLDGALRVARHPVQLYEAFWYGLVFLVLLKLGTKSSFRSRQGRLSGLLFIFIFTFRFFIEMFKEEQSRLLEFSSVLTMGQILSLPAIVLGIWFFVISRENTKTYSPEN